MFDQALLQYAGCWTLVITQDGCVGASILQLFQAEAALPRRQNQTRQFISSRLAGQRRAVCSGFVNRISESVFRVSRPDLALFKPVNRLQPNVRLTPPIRDGGRLENIAELVNLKCERMRNSRIIRIAFVIEAYRFTRMNVNNCIRV